MSLLVITITVYWKQRFIRISIDILSWQEKLRLGKEIC